MEFSMPVPCETTHRSRKNHLNHRVEPACVAEVLQAHGPCVLAPALVRVEHILKPNLATLSLCANLRLGQAHLQHPATGKYPPSPILPPLAADGQQWNKAMDNHRPTVATSLCPVAGSYNAPGLTPQMPVTERLGNGKKVWELKIRLRTKQYLCPELDFLKHLFIKCGRGQGHCTQLYLETSVSTRGKRLSQ